MEKTRDVRKDAVAKGLADALADIYSLKSNASWGDEGAALSRQEIDLACRLKGLVGEDKADALVVSALNARED